MSTPKPGPFGEVVGRLDQIVEAVRRKGASIDESLDLLDEAIELGLSAIALVDTDDPAASDEPAASDGSAAPATAPEQTTTDGGGDAAQGR
jgi:hypothetical protein